MNIYDSTGTLIEDLKFDDESYRSISLMGDHYCELHFHRSSYREYPVGCYIDFDGERYTLNNPAQLTKNNSWDIEYTLRMEASSHKAQHIMMRNPVDRRMTFDLTATPREHVQMVVDNLNRIYNILTPSSFAIDTARADMWRVGDVIDSSEKLVQYNYTSCWSALVAIADAFNTEFHIEGKTVHLKRVEFNKSNPLPMSYGKGNGFLSGIGRSNENAIPAMEYLYAQGSERNIDPSLYGYKTLRLPASQHLRYDGEHFEDESGFIATNAKEYYTDNDGMCLAVVGATHVTSCEASLDCTEIYPSREGTVTHVFTDNNIVYIRDIDIPAALDYNECMIAGENLVITFQSGQLAGKEFDVTYTHQTSGSGLTSIERKFKIVSQDIDGYEMPGTGFMPAIGDKYIITNCQLPSAYICDNSSKSGASWDMFRKCAMYMFDHAHPEYSFSGDVDQIWARQNWNNVKAYFKIGQHIGFTDQQFQQTQMLLRVVGVKQYINFIYHIELTIANYVKKSDILQEIKRVSANASQISPVTIRRAEWAARRASTIGLLLNGGNNRIEQAMRNQGGVISAINNISQNGLVIRLTEEQWAAIETPNNNSIYVVSDTNGKITNVYVGSQGIIDLNGFTYTFPFVLADGGNVLPQGFPLVLS